MYSRRIKFKSRNSLFLLGSMLLHLLLFVLLNISDLGPNKEKEDEFKLNAIKVANLTPASKPKPAAKTPSKRPTKKKRKPSKTKTLKKTNLAKATHRKSDNIPKQIKYKVTKKVTMIEKTVRQQKYTVERNPIKRKEIMKKLNVSQVKTFKTTTSTLERMTRVKTTTKVKTSPVRQKTWKQEITKQVNKQVKPTVQRRVVTKQVKYKSRQAKQTPKIVEKRVVYNRQIKKPIRQQVEKPTQLKVAEQPKRVTRQVTKVRQVTKKSTVVNKKTQHKIKKLEVVRKEAEKQVEQVQPTVQRKVVTKQVEYKPRQAKQTPKIVEKRVVYNRQIKEPIRQQVEKPTQLKVAEQPEWVTEQVTQFRQVTKKSTVVNKKTQHKIKKLEVVRKEAEKQVEQVQPTVQRKVVTKQVEYKPRQEKPQPKIEENRVVYKEQTKELNRKQTETPQQLEVAEVPEQVTEQVTHFRQVTKQTTVVTKVVSVPVIKGVIAFEQIQSEAEFVKENQELMPTAQREVTLKQLEYEERVVSVEQVPDIPQKVTYQQTATEQDVREITNAPDIPFEGVPTQTAALQVSMTTVAKQETLAYNTAPTMTQRPTVVSGVEHHEEVEKEVTQSSEMSVKTMTQPKANIEKTDVSQKQLVAFKESQSGVTKNIRSDSLSTLQALPSGTGSDASEVKIEANLPSGNITNRQLYRLIGSIDSDVKTAFVTINDITQLVMVVDGTYIAEVALSKGVNNLKIMAFNGKGRVGSKAFQLIFNPPRGGIATIHLESPENGKQGVKFGEPILVEGTIDDPNIIKATLLLNRTPIPLKVKNGRFSKEITLPEGKIFVFRVMAKNKNGIRAFSPAHTVLSTHDIDILNPRPY